MEVEIFKLYDPQHIFVFDYVLPLGADKKMTTRMFSMLCDPIFFRQSDALSKIYYAYDKLIAPPLELIIQLYRFP